MDSRIAGLLQNLWDYVLKKANIFLCLSGSHMGMMKREFFSYQAPLYGRASAQIHLKPFYFGATRDFFTNYSAVDRVALYSMFGGVPAYWERVDPSKSISWNIKRHLLTSNNLLQSEPRLLLQNFISDPHNYLSILSAIANGAHISIVSKRLGHSKPSRQEEAPQLINNLMWEKCLRLKKLHQKEMSTKKDPRYS